MVPYTPSAQYCSASCMYTPLVPAVISVFCVYVRENEILHSLTCSLSLCHTHPLCCHTPISPVNQSLWKLCLRRWHNGQDWSYLLSCMMGVDCMHVCVGGWVLVVLSPSLRVKRLLPFSTLARCEGLCLLSVYSSLFIFISRSFSLPVLSLPESRGHCWAERCCVLFSCCCQLSPRPLQDKAVIAPGTAALSSSSSKQICCNFICNWALNWEQIEAALCSSGKGEGSELGVVEEAGEMIPGSFMSGKVGLLSGREPRQGSYF